MREIPLTQGQVALVDDEDYERVARHKWHAHLKWGKWEPATGISYYTITMGRFILNCVPGDGKRVVYLNGDKLDNRNCNILVEIKNQVRRYDGFVEIDVGHGRKAVVNEADYSTIDKYTWGAAKSKGGQIWYAQTNIKRKNGKYSPVQMHKLIVPDVPSGMVRDHVNGNGLDNRRKNIRICEPKHNSRNQQAHRDKKHSRYKGVAIMPGNRTRPWFARIIVDYKQIYLGWFGTEIEAARAYDGGARQYFGEYARVNFPGDTA